MFANEYFPFYTSNNNDIEHCPTSLIRIPQPIRISEGNMEVCDLEGLSV